jgi:hypothetical protein
MVLIAIAAVAIVSVLGAGAAALVYLLTRQKNGSKNDPEDN